jgi:acyl-coenzyme A thioesterase PaaI-like protein
MPASLQDRYAPHHRCFGCGPSNELGLQLKSYPEEGDVLCRWHPSPHHEAYPGMLNGGIVGTLLDCHSNWTAAWALMNQRGLDAPPCTVTADYHVKLQAPTPSDRELLLRATLAEIKSDRAIVECTLAADGKVTASCRGTFVAVREGHPAYQRW